MKVYNYRYGECASPISDGCVIALGFFDGVHIAHREIILSAKRKADELGVPLGIFTFPAENEIKKGSPRLYSTKEKLLILENLGVDFTVLADFGSVSRLSPEAFITEVIRRDIGAAECFAGFNFRFGKAASGSAEMLVDLMRSAGASATVFEELKLNGETISTSLIREKILSGDTQGTRALLGAPYFLTGKVEHGNAVGRKLGYPTVNTPIGPNRIIPRTGVYASAVRARGRLYPALTNIGVCPTFTEREYHAETFILDFEGDLYGENIEVHLLTFLRDEKRFDSAEELIMQINIDKNQAIKELKDKTWQELGLN